MKAWSKAISVAAILLLLCQIFSVTALAAEDPASVTVSLTGDIGSVTENTVYKVALELDQTNVGGVWGVVKYNTDLFTFEGVGMTTTMATANHLGAAKDGVTTAQDVVKHDQEAGEITFALLADAANNDSEWVNFRFTAVAEASAAITAADFTLSDVTVANKKGTASIPSTTEDLTDVLVTDKALTVEGASIRTNGDYDLRFEVTLSKEFLGLQNVTKVGFVLVPTSLVKEGVQLQNDPSGVSFCKVNNGTQVRPNIAFVTMDEIKASCDESSDDYTIYANITNSALSHMTREYSLRSFVVVEVDNVEHIVYADNSGKNVADGTAARSCMGLARSLYEEYTEAGATYEAAIETIIGKATWTADEYKAVVKANCDALAWLAERGV